ncbi:MAG: undecaprenyl-diphosphatase UppP [Candidatus Uhrbacteria bacterium]|nr:undecaprenyl-diphosphatase UppP [Patescibacteria group bacterium]MBU1907111.1 undecaprenyl-diphosphatase UppP [Patescibacteria group bacterium]
MDIWQALILGIIQGITEFLPISSSGHLILIPELFGWDLQDLSFDIVMHLGTLVAVIVVLRRDIKKLLRAFFSRESSPERSVAWMIIVATIPVLVVGYFAGDYIGTVLRNPAVVIISLIFWGIGLAIADLAARKLSETDKLKKMKWSQAILIGFAQVLALIPGTSRSGITITAGLFAGLDRRTAARWSFLLSIPAIGAAGAKSILDLASTPGTLEFVPLFIGFLAAMISGAFAIKFLLELVARTSYMIFAWYRLVLAAIAIVILFVI